MCHLIKEQHRITSEFNEADHLARKEAPSFLSCCARTLCRSVKIADEATLHWVARQGLLSVHGPDSLHPRVAGPYA